MNRTGKTGQWDQFAVADTHRLEKERKDFLLRIRKYQEQEEALDQEQEQLEDTLVTLADTMADRSKVASYLPSYNALSHNISLATSWSQKNSPNHSAN